MFLACYFEREMTVCGNSEGDYNNKHNTFSMPVLQEHLNKSQSDTFRQKKRVSKENSLTRKPDYETKVIYWLPNGRSYQPTH